MRFEHTSLEGALDANCGFEHTVTWETTRNLTGDVDLPRSTTVAQVVMLEGKGGRKVVVANTHLFGHPDATHVRLVQSAVLARGMKEIVSLEAWSRASMVVCGDLNSLPGEGVCDFFVDGGVGMDHEDWWRGLKFENIMSRQEREARWFEDKTERDEKNGEACGLGAGIEGSRG